MRGVGRMLAGAIPARHAVRVLHMPGLQAAQAVPAVRRRLRGVQGDRAAGEDVDQHEAPRKAQAGVVEEGLV
eukprot:3673392-Pyramimonas_sp.AAC.1